MMSALLIVSASAYAEKTTFSISGVNFEKGAYTTSINESGLNSIKTKGCYTFELYGNNSISELSKESLKEALRIKGNKDGSVGHQGEMICNALVSEVTSGSYHIEAEIWRSSSAFRAVLNNFEDDTIIGFFGDVLKAGSNNYHLKTVGFLQFDIDQSGKVTNVSRS